MFKLRFVLDYVPRLNRCLNAVYVYCHWKSRLWMLQDSGYHKSTSRRFWRLLRFLVAPLHFVATLKRTMLMGLDLDVEG